MHDEQLAALVSSRARAPLLLDVGEPRVARQALGANRACAMDAAADTPSGVSLRLHTSLAAIASEHGQ